MPTTIETTAPTSAVIDEVTSGSSEFLASVPTGNSWLIRLYDIAGDEVVGYDMNPVPEETNFIKHATNRNLRFALNGIDECSFSLYLDDPMAAEITRLESIIKVWRIIKDAEGTIIYEDGSDEPCFAGVVSSTIKNGSENMMHIKAFSPLWRLQFRFHLLNHYLVTDETTGDPYLQSRLMWKLIDLVNGAFGVESQTGIQEGSYFGIGEEPEMAPYFVAKGSNTYIHIFETIMNRPGGVDIIPEYYHDDGSSVMMFFNTDIKRGTDISADFFFTFHVEEESNLSDLTEEITVNPDEFANFLWAVGNGGPNSGLRTEVENESDDNNGYANIGIYMKRFDAQDINRLGSIGPPPTYLYATAEQELARAREPKRTYSITVSPAGGVYYSKDFTLGDVVTIAADKYALQVNEAQRIYEASLSISDNNIETASLLTSSDFFGKVAA